MSPRLAASAVKCWSWADVRGLVSVVGFLGAVVLVVVFVNVLDSGGRPKRLALRASSSSLLAEVAGVVVLAVLVVLLVVVAAIMDDICRANCRFRMAAKSRWRRVVCGTVVGNACTCR